MELPRGIAFEASPLQLGHFGRWFLHPVLQRRLAVRFRPDAKAHVRGPGRKPVDPLAGGHHLHGGLGLGPAIRGPAGRPVELEGDHRHRRRGERRGHRFDGSGGRSLAGVHRLRSGLRPGQRGNIKLAGHGDGHPLVGPEGVADYPDGSISGLVFHQNTPGFQQLPLAPLAAGIV